MRKIKKALVEVDDNLKKIVKPLPEENLTSFTWTVFKEYEIQTRYESADKRNPTKPVAVRCVAAKDPVFGKRRKIKPLEELPALYNEFTKIDCDSEESILGFIHTFGLLTGEREQRIDSLIKAVSDVKNCLSLYAAIYNGSLKEVYYLNHLDELLLERITGSVSNANFTPKELIMEEMQAKALYALARHINERLKGCNPVLIVKDKNVIPLNTCRNLLEAIYLQIYEKISGKKELVQCEECGSWFFPTRKGQQYCPPLYGEKKSLCLNRKSVRENRERGLK